MQYSILCQYWLYTAVANNVPIPLSLFYPCWLLDRPAFLKEYWVISWDKAQQPAQEQSSSRYTGDRFLYYSKDLILEAVLAAIEKYRSLPVGQAENFASKFAKGTSRLNIQYNKQTASLVLLLLILPEPLIKPNLKYFPSSRKRTMTGLEAAEEEEAERRRQQRVAAVAEQEENARDKHKEREAERTAAIAEYWYQS